MGKKEWLLMSLSVVCTLLLALGLTRWLAPQLLGVPVDLQLVKVQEEKPPYFENIFNEDVFKSKKNIIADPLILRGKPLIPTGSGLSTGPHDILGFRNRQVPNVSDIITIGDSQTYGNNVPLEMNWPSKLSSFLKDKTNSVYSMAVGGWGATQYMDIFDKALYFRPIVVVVAYYTGNDPLNSFLHVYGDERWKEWRSNPDITAQDAPSAPYPDKESDQWEVKFARGYKTKFTSAYRYASNKYDDPVVREGYDIMARTAEKIAAKARQYNIRLIFVIIPTKEFVYAKKMLDEGITPREDYTLLVRDEQKNINDLAIRLKNIPGSAYIDLPSRLQAEAQRFPFLYPMTENGHPAEFGYEVIAGALAPYVRQLLPQKLSGPVVVNTHNKKFYYVVHKEGVWLFANEKILTGNGWNPGLATPISQRFIENMPITASVMTINPEQFGPGSTLIK